MCDIEFQQCLHQQCINITKDKADKEKHLTGKFDGLIWFDINLISSLVCDTATKLLLMGILSFGCKAYKDAQKDACVCPAAPPNEL